MANQKAFLELGAFTRGGTKQAFGSVASGFKEIANGMRSTAQSMRALGQSSRGSDGLDRISRSLNAISLSYDKQTKAIKTNASELKSSEAVYAQQVKTIEKLNNLATTSSKYAQKVRDLANAQKSQGADPKYVRHLDDTAVKLDGLSNKSKIAAANSWLYTKSVVGSSAVQDKYQSKLEKSWSALQKFGQQKAEVTAVSNDFDKAITRVGKSLKSYASYVVASFVINEIRNAIASLTGEIITYDQALKDLQAITGATDEEMAVLDAKILQVAADTKFSAVEVAEGVKILGQAGLSASESILTIDAVANLATGTLTSMSNAVDLITTAMRVYDLSAERSGHISDVFANAVNGSKLSIDKLRVAFNYVGPIASQAGISFEETAASMMLLANNGLRASTIGTGLRNVFEKLLTPTEDLTNAMNLVGLSVEDFDPRVQSMTTIVKNLSRVVTDSSVALNLFGKRGSSAVLALTSQGAAGFSVMLETANRAGEASRQAAKQMEGLGVRAKNLSDRIKNLSIVFGKGGLSSVIGFVIDVGRSLISLLTQLAGNPIGNLIIQIGLITATIATLITAVKILQLLGIGKLIGIWTGAFSGLTTTVSGAAASMWGMTAAAVGLNAALGIAAVVIGALVFLYVSLKDKSQKLYAENIKLVGTYKSMVETVDQYNAAAIRAGEGSKEQADSAKSLREQLLKTAEGETALADAALAAALSIDPLTGKLAAGGEALKFFWEEAKRLEAVNLMESLENATAALKDAGGWGGTIAAMKDQLGSFGEFVGKALYVAIFSSVDKIPGQLKDVATESITEFGKGWDTVELRKKISDGTASFEELERAVVDAGRSGSSQLVLLKKFVDQLKLGGVQILAKLQETGNLDLNESVDSIMNLAVAYKYLGSTVGIEAEAVRSAIVNMKQSVGTVTEGLADQWLAETKAIATGSSRAVGDLRNLSSATRSAILDLNESRLLSEQSAKKALAEELQLAKIKLDSSAKELKDYMEFERKRIEIERRSIALSRTMDDSSKRDRLLKNEDYYNKEQALQDSLLAGKSISEALYAKRSIQIEKERATKIQEILGTNFDKDKLKTKLEAETKAVDTELKRRQLVVQSDRALTKLSEEDATNESIRLEQESLERKLQLAQDYQKKINDNLGFKGAAAEEANKAVETADKALLEFQLNTIAAYLDKYRERKEKLTELEAERTKEYKDEIEKQKKIENDAASAIVEINRAKNKKLADLEEKRKDQIKKSAVNLADIHTSAEDKIREIRQRGLTDEQKKLADLATMHKKFVDARKALTEAQKTGDESALERAKKLTEAGGAIAASLDNQGKAIAGIKKEEKLLTDIEKASSKIKLDAIAKERAEANADAAHKISLIKTKEEAELAASARVHNDKVDKFEIEEAKLKQLIRGYQEFVNTIGSKVKGSEFKVDFSGVDTDTKTKGGLTAGLDVEKTRDQIKAEFAELQKNTKFDVDGNVTIKLNKQQAQQEIDTTVSEILSNATKDDKGNIKLTFKAVSAEEKARLDAEYKALVEKFNKDNGIAIKTAVIPPEESEVKTVGTDAGASLSRFMAQATHPWAVEITTTEAEKQIKKFLMEAEQRYKLQLGMSMTKKADGGPAIGMSSGGTPSGRLPGPGSTKDTIPVLARAGEWFIRNESVAKWSSNVGTWFMQAVNEPMSYYGKYLQNLLASGGKFRRMAVGGGLNVSKINQPSQQSVPNFGTIVIQDSVSRATVQADPLNAGILLQQLERMGRLASS